jgi:ATP synthase F1 gamma subunit
MSLYEIKKKLETLVVFEKATYAMKIVSSSLHAKIKKNLFYLEKLTSDLSTFSQNTFTSEEKKKTNSLVMHIFIGSERGFCGDYNIGIARKYHDIMKHSNHESIPTIIIGKCFFEKIKKKGNISNITFFPEFKEKSFQSIEKKIKKIILEKHIETLKIFSYKSKSIGNKEITETMISAKGSSLTVKKDFFTGHFSAQDIINAYQELYIETTLYYLFYMAFLTEQGMRFTSMDTALKNTKEALSEQQKLYFKTRQENINKQLQDLGVALLL